MSKLDIPIKIGRGCWIRTSDDDFKDRCLRPTRRNPIIINLVRLVRLELTRLTALASKTSVATNYTTDANMVGAQRIELRLIG
jgi:hypothetical protein